MKFFDQVDPLDVTVIVIGDVPAALRGTGKQSFPDVIVNGFLGYPCALHQFSDFQAATPTAGIKIVKPRTLDPPSSSDGDCITFSQTVILCQGESVAIKFPLTIIHSV